MFIYLFVVMYIFVYMMMYFCILVVGVMEINLGGEVFFEIIKVCSIIWRGFFSFFVYER